MENAIRATYYISKQSNTYADVFMAYGMARLLEILLGRAHLGDATASFQVSIEDGGPYYLIRLSQPLSAAQLEQMDFFASPAPFLASRKTPAPENMPVRDVDETWERVRAYSEQRSALYDQGLRGQEIANQLRDQEPPHDWQIVTFLGDWRMQAQGIYNRIVTGWVNGKPHWKEHLKAMLAIAASPSPQPEILTSWRALAKKDGIEAFDTASQLLNPHQGKGQNETKASALRMDNIKDRPWLEEFLKTIGLWHCLTPRQTTDTKDWKIYILAPRQITLAASQEAFRKFNSYIWNERRGDATSLKTDITSVLLFYKTWLDYVEMQREEDFDADTARPENVVAGFHVAQFKLLSQNAYTMVNLSFLSLPHWGESIQTKADVKAVKAMLDEQLEVIRGIDETHSDGYELLRRYRDFVAGENWSAFFNFAAAYAHEALRRMNQNPNTYVPLFSTTHLRRLLMTQKRFVPILESAGFQNVAYAIRHSTIVPQSRKARGQDYLYDVRYGLGAELMRKATVKEEFVAALSEFMQSYNQENVQKLESKGQQLRKDLRTSDIEEIIRLVDEYGSEVVANLLIAYGYAREPREDETPNSNS